MKFMLLLENPVFLSLSFYDDLQQPQLYLHLKNTNTNEASNLLIATNELKAIATRADGTKYLVQPSYFDKSGTLRLDNIYDIALALNWISDAGYISFSQCKELAAIFRLFKNAKLEKFAKTWENKFNQFSNEENAAVESLTPISPRIRNISLDQHIAQAFAAVKRGDKKLVEVLLGNGIKEQDVTEFKKRRIRLDSQTDVRFTREFHALILVYQHATVEEFTKLNTLTQETFDTFRRVLTQCIRDAKEVIIGAKINYPYRPYLPGRNITSIENFAGWLHNFYDTQVLLPYTPTFSSLENTAIQKIKKDLVKHREITIDSLMQLDGLRLLEGVKLGELEADIIRKEGIHAENVAQLLQSSETLPEIYHCETEADKLALSQLLQLVKVPINSVDAEGNTLLHYAMDKDNREIAILLIRCGIDATLQNHAQQTAHAYAGKELSFLLELQRIAHSEITLQESQFLALYKHLSDTYESSLRRDEEWLKSNILKMLGTFYGLDEEITLEKRRIKNVLDRLHQQSVVTGNPELLLKGIETLCPKNKTKRGPRNKSVFYDGALKLARRTRADSAMLGTLGAVSVSSVTRLEQTLKEKNQEIARLTTEKAEVVHQNTELATQNSQLTTELTMVKKSNEEQRFLITKLRESNQRWESRHSELETKFESMMKTVIQRLDYQEKKQNELSLSLPTHHSQFFSQASSSSPSTQNISLPGLMYHKVPGTGHCLFHAVALHLGQNQATLRGMISIELACNLEAWRPLIALPKGQTLENYLAVFREGTECADHIELDLYMRVLRRPIIVITPDSNIRNPDALQRSGEPIFVYYNGHDHYDALLPSKSYSSQTVLNQLLQSVESMATSPAIPIVNTPSSVSPVSSMSSSSSTHSLSENSDSVFPDHSMSPLTDLTILDTTPISVPAPALSRS